MSTPDSLILDVPSRLPDALREPVEGVSFAAYLIVEAARLDALPERAVLGWIGVRQAAFERAEESWSERLGDALADTPGFDEVYEDLLGRALALWSRAIDPLDRDIDAWMRFQRHALAADDPGDFARRAGLTPGDEVRLARLWRARLASPDLGARAALAWSAPLGPMPAVTLSPFVFPKPPEAT